MKLAKTLVFIEFCVGLELAGTEVTTFLFGVRECLAWRGMIGRDFRFQVLTEFRVGVGICLALC